MPDRAIIIQTAFPGDVILTLPLVQILKARMPVTEIDMLVVPAAAELLRNHPAIREIFVYDKRGRDRGFSGFVKTLRALKTRNYGLALIPHRSVRSASLARLSAIPRRIGFDTSSGRFMLNSTVRYDPSVHEIERNLSLLSGVGIEPPWERVLPELFPSQDDARVVDSAISGFSGNSLIGIAPGTVWNTKRWPRFTELVEKLVKDDHSIVLIGGKDDELLCGNISRSVASPRVLSAAGMLTMLQSAELLRRCRLLICNDSAPMHMAVAMRTPVVSIFGATVPGFGFFPYGKRDVVVETKGLPCRPCAIHGGDECPIRTFDCMMNISADMVLQNIEKVISPAVNG